jgi:3-hydroxyisobutyrate dehydrogenase
MGFPMAGHLKRAGHDLVVFNRTQAVAARWVEEFGGVSAPTPRTASSERDFVLSCVGNDDDLRSVTLGADGAFAGMTAGAVFIDHTTASATVTRQLGAEAKGKGLGFVDAPVSGGQAGAQNGQPTVMCGGQVQDYRPLEPVISAYARSCRLMAPVGAGQLTKMVNQICTAGLVQALSEGLRFAEAAGLDAISVVEVISKGAAQSWQMDNRHKTMIERRFDFGFAVDWMRKDLAICLDEARRNGAALPVTALVDQFYRDIQAQGRGAGTRRASSPVSESSGAGRGQRTVFGRGRGSGAKSPLAASRASDKGFWLKSGGAGSRGVSCRRSEVTVAIDGEAMSIEETPLETPPQHSHDFSNVQGLQVVGANPGAAGDAAAEDAWREALRLELEARTARFHQAVDASIVLSDDGVIRWLGDPVARLAAGPDLLTPRTLVLADPILPDGARDVVTARLDLWLAATTRRLLGPLLALRSLEEESEPVRQLAAKIADSLGVLEREPSRSQIRGLDQNSRAALRRHGVRFGAYYVYVPQSLKPAARSLALQLWSLRAPKADDEELVKTLLPLASSGRTSLPVSPSISKDGYRVAGFRPCGERAVRVDIVERLSDMIRAALVVSAPSNGAPSPGSAFLVTGQMTSLTGCSAETFASILRSLGYESFEIEGSRLSPPQPAALLDAAPVAEAPNNGAEGTPAGGDGPDRGAADAAPNHASSATLAEQSASGDASDGRAGAAPDPASPPPSDEQPPGGAASDVAANIVRGPDDGAGDAPPAPEADPDEGVVQNNDGAAAPLEPMESAPAQAPEAGPEATGAPVEAKVIAWRFARRPRPERPKRGPRRSVAPGGVRLRERESAGDPGARPEKEERRRVGPGRDGQEKEAAHRKRERFNRADETRRKTAPKPTPQAASAQFEPRRAVPVDPNSPFAKLLELRSALEKQGKNR